MNAWLRDLLLLMVFCTMAMVSAKTQHTFSVLPGLPQEIMGRFDDLYFLSDQLGFMCTADGEIFKTQDGGLTMELVYNNDQGRVYFRSIEFLTPEVGLAGTLDSLLFRTEDGGSSWQKVDLPRPIAGICGMHALDEKNVFVCGSVYGDAFILRSMDAGKSFTYQDMKTHATGLIEIYFLNDSLGFAGGFAEDGGVLLKTEDGGISWHQVFISPTKGDYVWKIQSLWNDPSFVYASIESFVTSFNMCKSIDGGAHWMLMETPEYDMQGIGFVTRNHGWIGGHKTTLYETKDGGQSWEDLRIVPNVNRIQILNDSTIFAGGNKVHKYTNEASTPAYTFLKKKG